MSSTKISSTTSQICLRDQLELGVLPYQPYHPGMVPYIFLLFSKNNNCVLVVLKQFKTSMKLSICHQEKFWRCILISWFPFGKMHRISILLPGILRQLHRRVYFTVYLIYFIANCNKCLFSRFRFFHHLWLWLFKYGKFWLFFNDIKITIKL